MEIIKYKKTYLEQVSELLADFRVTLRSFKGEITSPDIESAREEITSFSKDKNYPIYLYIDNNEVLGYMILKIDGVIWVEQIHVRSDMRRKGVGSMLFAKAEELSNGDTLFNYVHPNNEVMISFLKSKGYNVLNLIEIRKPFKGEKNTQKVKVGNNIFDY